MAKDAPTRRQRFLLHISASAGHAPDPVGVVGIVSIVLRCLGGEYNAMPSRIASRQVLDAQRSASCLLLTRPYGYHFFVATRKCATCARFSAGRASIVGASAARCWRRAAGCRGAGRPRRAARCRAGRQRRAAATGGRGGGHGQARSSTLVLGRVLRSASTIESSHGEPILNASWRSTTPHMYNPHRHLNDSSASPWGGWPPRSSWPGW